MKNNKELPKLINDKDAEDFISEADLTEYDLSQMSRVSFEFKNKTKQINLRMSEDLLIAVKEHAKSHHVPYQRFIREAIEKALRN